MIFQSQLRGRAGSLLTNGLPLVVGEDRLDPGEILGGISEDDVFMKVARVGGVRVTEAVGDNTPQHPASPLVQEHTAPRVSVAGS